MVVAVLAVLTAIVAAAVTGIKSTGVDGQVKSDAKASQTAIDNFNNKSIKTAQFPEAQPEVVVSTVGASDFHIYADVFRVGESSATKASGTVTVTNFATLPGATVTIDGIVFTGVAANPGANEFQASTSDEVTAASLNTAIIPHPTVDATVSGAVVTINAVSAGDSGNAITLASSTGNLALSAATLSGGADVTDGAGDNVILVRTDGLGETLADKVTPSGKTSADAVLARTFVDFTAGTNTWDDTGAVKTSTFVPDFLLKDPTSLILKGDETKDLGTTNNTFEEYLWVLLVNSPSTKEESRAVEAYRMSAADCTTAITGSSIISGRALIDPAAISTSDVANFKAGATGCTSSNSIVKGLIYDQVF